MSREIDDVPDDPYRTYNSYHYVWKPYDDEYEPWRVDRHLRYPQYANDHWQRVNSYDWRHHPGSVYAPLNENSQKSLEYRKYVPDESGLPTYWYRSVIEPSYEWMFEQGS